jgi:hypothetical protein
LDWVDPTIALRLQHHFGNGHSITATGNFGGLQRPRGSIEPNGADLRHRRDVAGLRYDDVS